MRLLAAFTLAATFATVTSHALAIGQSPSGNGARRFDDLRELNNKLARTITRLGAGPIGHVDIEKELRTLQDLEVTKLRAVDQFPSVFGLPYGESFTTLSCIDDDIAQARLFLILLQRGLVLGPHTGRLGSGAFYVWGQLVRLLKDARGCKDRLEIELQRGSNVPVGVSDDLRELNNKLARAIASLEAGPMGHVDIEKELRTLQDLEVTKLRAVDQFPEILDPPYGETFRKLSCVDQDISQGRLFLILLQKGLVLGPHTGRLGSGAFYVWGQLIQLLKDAKACKDTLEVELMQSFDLKPTEKTEVGVNATTPNGTDTQGAGKLNAPKPLQTAYAQDGFVGRHEHDYFAVGVNGSTPDAWPVGHSVLFFDVFDLFGSSAGAYAAEQASQQNLKSEGFTPIRDSSLGPGEAAFQKQGSPMSTVIDVQRGTFIMKVAGACKGCTPGSVDPALQKVAQVQLARAVANGFPATASPPPTTTTPTTTAPKPPPKPTTAHAYRGPIDNGVFLADGNGSHIKLTIDSRRVRITFGTDFRYVCQGNQTLHVTGKRTQVNSFDFHPGWAWHPISAAGAFSITLFHHVLAGQFVSPTTVRGTFTFEGVIEASNPTPTECHGNHSWTATLGGRPSAGIGPIEVMIHHVSGPIGKGEATRRDALFQDYLQRQGFVQDTSNPNRASDAATGKSTVWNRDLETWDDAKTGQHLSGSGNDPAVLAYVFWQLDLFPKGFTRSDPYHASNSSTGETAVFNLKKLQWVDAKSGAGLSRTGR